MSKKKWTTWFREWWTDWRHPSLFVSDEWITDHVRSRGSER